ncbi:rhodanese-like domain-containing protein [Clostridium polyendosporum]|uniref:Rhodanese-like domain-containing protein n=1 Tax=Clostridium polyendosporum TaxID=69208 RepID=A0A919VGU8_9CLOT|nr:rhodanese-like domain-containing protein [Clostridium polyendosporum]GIM29011.1 rhodanese-like domain-containing protein [Clostridium polyendosporum]
MNQITIAEAKKLINDNENVLVLDVRTQEEYTVGHILESIPIPANELPLRIHEIEEYYDKPVIVHCQSGRRSPAVVLFLENNGFKEIYHMYEGYKKWR